MNDGLAGLFLLRREDLRPASLECRDKWIVALLPFEFKQRKVSGETFAEPDVVPVLFRHRIPEPLMRHFVGYNARNARRPEQALIEEDLARMLHAAVNARRFNTREFFIRVRPDAGSVELSRLAHGSVERGGADVTIPRVQPGL